MGVQPLVCQSLLHVSVFTFDCFFVCFFLKILNMAFLSLPLVCKILLFFFGKWCIVHDCEVLLGTKQNSFNFLYSIVYINMQLDTIFLSRNFKFKFFHFVSVINLSCFVSLKKTALEDIKLQCILFLFRDWNFLIFLKESMISMIRLIFNTTSSFVTHQGTKFRFCFLHIFL